MIWNVFFALQKVTDILIVDLIRTAAKEEKTHGATNY